MARAGEETVAAGSVAVGRAAVKGAAERMAVREEH